MMVTLPVWLVELGGLPGVVLGGLPGVVLGGSGLGSPVGEIRVSPGKGTLME